jgi:hypothetical protein
MNRRTVIIAVVTIVAAIVAAVVFIGPYRAASTPPGSGAAGGDDAPSILPKLAARGTPITSSATLKEHMRAAERVRVPASAPAGVAPAASLTDVDIAAALDHLADALWYRLFQSDFAAYENWRTGHGYRQPSAQRVARDPSLRASLRGQARLAPEYPDPDNWCAAIWSASGASLPRPDAVSSVQYATQVFTGTLPQRVEIDPILGNTRAFPSLIQLSPQADSITATFADTIIGQGWPIWAPPRDVLARVSTPGTALVEVRVTPIFTDGSPRAGSISVLMAHDRATKSWWIVQFWMYDVDASNESGFGAYEYIF